MEAKPKKTAKPPKEKKGKFLFYDDNYQLYTKLAQSSVIPYEIISSNYTYTIKSELFTGGEISFCQNMMSNQCFAAFAKVKSDIIKSGLLAPNFAPDHLKYFKFNEDKILKYAPEKIYNVDIKSAYASVLYLNNFIQKKTYGYLMSLKKVDRLAAVGMLASSKKHFIMNGKECVSTFTKKSEYSNYFFYCVNKVNELMSECADKIGSDFLFFWVDGIFCKTEAAARKVTEILEKHGYRYSFDICESFRMVENEREKVLEYFKPKKDGRDFKRLSMPKKNDEAAKFILEMLSILK